MAIARAILAFFVIGALAMSAYADPGQDLARLRQISKLPQPSQKEYFEAKAILARLETESASGDPAVVKTLFDIIEDSGSHGLVSEQALPVLATKTDAASARHVVSLMASKLAELKDKPVQAKDLVHGRDASLLDRFVESCAEPLLPQLSDPRPLMDLLVEFCTVRTGWFRPDVQQKAGRLIAAAPVDKGIRKAAALRLIKITATHYPYPEGLERLFEPQDIPALRKLIRAPNNTPSTFCWGAADVLAHLADETAIQDVRAFLQANPVGQVPLSDQVQAYAYRIEIQKPPEKLLDFIRGKTSNGTSRVWAMRRAIDYGIDKKTIRDAILAHAEAVKDDRVQMDEVASLKQAANDCGVLNKDDLPGVAIAESPATP
ncbi:MAG: hypothetical protein L6Q92_03685 [Phycisphaerae bacterium]|nr:hypothetical protein [Phycisphaerae bacterium]